MRDANKARSCQDAEIVVTSCTDMEEESKEFEITS